MGGGFIMGGCQGRAFYPWPKPTHPLSKNPLTCLPPRGGSHQRQGNLWPGSDFEVLAVAGVLQQRRQPPRPRAPRRSAEHQRHRDQRQQRVPHVPRGAAALPRLRPLPHRRASHEVLRREPHHRPAGRRRGGSNVECRGDGRQRAVVLACSMALHKPRHRCSLGSGLHGKTALARNHNDGAERIFCPKVVPVETEQVCWHMSPSLVVKTPPWIPAQPWGCIRCLPPATGRTSTAQHSAPQHIRRGADDLDPQRVAGPQGVHHALREVRGGGAPEVAGAVPPQVLLEVPWWGQDGRTSA